MSPPLSSLLSLSFILAVPIAPKHEAVTAPPSAASSRPPSVIGAARAPGAWAVIHGGALWVCWSETVDCWQRVELELELAEDRSSSAPEDNLESEELPELEAPKRAAGQWRLGFSGPSTLWIGVGEHSYRVDRGRRRAQPVTAEPPIRLLRPRPLACGPRGWLPSVEAGRLGWARARTCPETGSTTRCRARSPLPQLRKPAGLQLRAGLELAAVRAWQHARPSTSSGPGASALARAAGIELVFVVEVGLDLRAAARHRREREAAQRRGLTRTVEFATPRGPARVASSERAALSAALCEVQP